MSSFFTRLLSSNFQAFTRWIQIQSISDLYLWEAYSHWCFFPLLLHHSGLETQAMNCFGLLHLQIT